MTRRDRLYQAGCRATSPDNAESPDTTQSHIEPFLLFHMRMNQSFTPDIGDSFGACDDRQPLLLIDCLRVGSSS